MDRIKIVIVAFVAAACGEIASVDLPPADAGTTTSSSSSSTSSSSSSGATSSSSSSGAPPIVDASAPDAEPPSKGVCKKDQDCNDDPSVSALHGQCFDGLCVCNASFHVQPSGKCAAKAPPDCMASSGTCRQAPAQCKDAELQGALQTNMSCGDFAPAVCCIPTAACKAPVDLVCCGVAPTASEPLCVNGWKTCENAKPALRKKGCL